MQIQQLGASITGYRFPAVYYNFVTNAQVDAPNMLVVEAAIVDLLRAQNINDVRAGLANVLYWGYAQIGYGANRVERFLHLVTNNHLTNFKTLLAGNPVPNLIQVRNLRIPEFSGVSFVSKVLMFLDPKDYCVLDQQLAALNAAAIHRALNRLVRGSQIRVTRNNQAVYDDWRNECRAITNTYFNGQHRVVDVERGFFNLIQQGHLQLAQAIYASA